MLKIGSQAIKDNYPDFPRQCHDIDYAVSRKSLTSKSKRGEEYFYIPFLDFGNDIINMDELYTLKISHGIRNINFGKHLHDIVFLKNKGHSIIPNLLDRLLIYWNVIHGIRRTPNFNQLNSDFFKDSVDRKYNHDQLHGLVKFGNQPMFELIKLDKTKAEPSEDLFNNLSIEQKYHVVLEEAYVIALERYVIPKRYPYQIAFQNSMRDLITRLFPQWLAIWSLDHYLEIKDQLTDYTKFLK